MRQSNALGFTTSVSFAMSVTYLSLAAHLDFTLLYSPMTH